MKLIRASINDAELLWKMQVDAFYELYEKYQDEKTSPATEDVARVVMRLNQSVTYYYFIVVNNVKIGAIRIVDLKKVGEYKRISPLFILKEYRGNGYAQKAIKLVEKIHGSSCWELDTIFEEKGICYLYEKMGYKKTGEFEKINDKMTLVFYRKE